MFVVFFPHCLSRCRICQIYLTFGYLRFFLALESQGLHRMGRAQEAEECQKEIVEILEVRAV